MIRTGKMTINPSSSAPRSTSAQESISPQPPVSNIQSKPSRSSQWSERFKGIFRPVTHTFTTPVSAINSQGSKEVQGKRQLDSADFRAPTKKEKARDIDRRQKRVGEMVSGNSPAGNADNTESEHSAFNASLSAMFDGMTQNKSQHIRLLNSQPTPIQALNALSGQLRSYSTEDPQLYQRPLLLGKVISHFTRNAAQAQYILEELCNPDATGDAFHAQLALMRCHGPGCDALLACQPLQNVPQDPTEAAIQKEAFRHKLTAAYQLCLLLPSGLRPENMAECLDIAKEAAYANPDEQPHSERVFKAAKILSNYPILVKALCCASTLVDTPSAMPSTDVKAAYLAYRNGIQTTDELSDATNRLYKINTYIDRSTEYGWKSFANGLQRRLLGKEKNPLKALVKMGTAGSKTRHPEDDLAKRTVAMDKAIESLNAQLADFHQEDQPNDDALRKSIITATIRQWKSHIVNKGWDDKFGMSEKRRKAIAQDVARQLGIPVDSNLFVRVDQVLVQSEVDKQGKLTVDTLKSWVQGEQLTVTSEAMADFKLMQHHGDVFIKHPHHEQVRQLLRDAIKDTRQTYNVDFSSAASRGVSASIADIVGATSLAGMPVLYAGPGITAVGANAADVRGGSNVHGGLLSVNSTRGGSGAISATVGFGYKFFDFLNVGPSATFTPLKIDHTRANGIAVRTRMDTIGSTDPDAWRTKLRDVYDTITEEPNDPNGMWDRLAEGFFKDPNVSIQKQASKQTNAGGLASVNLSATVDPTGSGGLKLGPTAGLSFQKTYRTTIKTEDQSGQNRAATLHSTSAGHGFGASIGLLGSAPAITGPLDHNKGHFGQTQGLALPSGSLTASVSFLRDAAGATVRLVEDQGHLQADYCVVDTETATAEGFAKYIDSQRAQWIEALGGGEAAGAQLDEYLTRIVNDQVSGNMTYGERRRLTPQAGHKIDNFKAQIAAVELLGTSTTKELAEIEHFKGEVTRVINDYRSWDPRSLWALGLNSEVKTKGLNLIVAANNTYSVTAPRQSAVLVATRAPNRDQDLETSHL